MPKSVLAKAPVKPERAFTALLCFLISCVLLVSGCKPKADESANQTTRPALKVQTTALATQSWQRTIHATGSIVARDEVLIGAEVSGVRAADVQVEVGETVKQGQLLVQLDDRLLRADLAQASAQRKQAHAALLVAQTESRRALALREKKLISERDADQAAANLVSAQAGLELASAALDYAKLRLSFSSVRAPNDGLISARTVQEGTLVAPGMELFRIIKNGALEWRAELASEPFSLIRLGDEVELTLDSVRVAGRVRAMDAALRMDTRTALIYVDLPLQPALRAGTFARGKILREKREVQTLPASAIARRDGFAYVFLLQDAKAVLRRVELGEAQLDRIEILGGLNPDDAVVAAGIGFLADGDRVEEVGAVAPVGTSTR